MSATAYRPGMTRCGATGTGGRFSRRQLRRINLLLKAGMMAAVILALAQPVLSIRDRKVALAVLVDTSASVTDADLTRESALLREMDSARGSNLMDVIPFARVPRALDPKETD